MRAQQLLMPDGDESWIALDDTGVPVAPVVTYLRATMRR